MLVTTTVIVDGQTVKEYFGVVSGEAILGTNVLKDMFANVRDIVGGRAASYEKSLRKAKAMAMDEMIQQAEDYGGNAVLGVDLDYTTVGAKGSMLMVVASGTAALVERDSG